MNAALVDPDNEYQYDAVGGKDISGIIRVPCLNIKTVLSRYGDYHVKK